MKNKAIQRFTWVGSQSLHLDSPDVTIVGDVVVGRYGGNTAAGAVANEDGALVWAHPDGLWEFALLLDAHASAESAELVVRTFRQRQEALLKLLALPVSVAFSEIQNYLLTLFRSDDFRAQCRGVRGETSCLICVRKKQFLWWFNVGDCLLNLHHPDLARHGQRMLNQRSFYEWVGQVNTFDLPVPCYSSGVRELRTGRNTIVLSTDGLLEGMTGADPESADNRKALEEQIKTSLASVHENRGLDSATVIAWIHDNDRPAAYPTTSLQQDS